MNRVYRLIGNTGQGMWLEGSELARGQRKSAAKRFSVLAGALALVSIQGLHATPPVNALPTGEAVVFGSASFDRSTPNQLNIHQNSTKLISNWNGFDIGSAATVNFIQPTASTLALNRVTSGSPSEIFGKLNANGQLLLVNPAGITFGLGSQVSTGSLLASSMGISDRNFINNDLTFERNGSRGQVSNLGTLVATTGNVVLLGNSVQNQRSIQSVNGNIMLANGDRLKVLDHNISMLQASSLISLIRNTGTLTATRVEVRKGQVILLGEQANPRSKVEVRGTVNSQNFWARARQVSVNGALTTTGNTALEASQSVNISAPLNISGNGVLLSVVHGSNPGDSIVFSGSGRVNLAGSNPYVRINGNFYQLVKTLAELQAISTDTTTLAANYVLANDIDATPSPGNYFRTIGSAATPFSGRFNGFGYAINQLGSSLFGYTSHAAISNARLNNVSIWDGDMLGALVASNHDTPITNSYSTGDIRTTGGGLIGENFNSSVYNSHSAVNAGYHRLPDNGGLIGYNENSPVVNSYATGAVTGGSQVGGLIGTNVNSDLTNVYATGTVTSTSSLAGGLVGSNSGNISNSYATGNIEGGDDYGQMYDIDTMGGLVGQHNSGTISHSYATGNVNAYGAGIGGLVGYNNGSIVYSHASGAASGGDSVGGLVGYNKGSIDQSYATGIAGASDYVYQYYNYGPMGTASGGLVGSSIGSISNSYATGNAYAVAAAGGLVGYQGTSAATVTNSYSTGKAFGNGAGGLSGVGQARQITGGYWDLTTSTNTTSRGGTGLTTAQMQQLSSFVGWDISNQIDGNSIWYIDEGNARPVLRALLP
jgi:filamentous hemagglutinin family protein